MGNNQSNTQESRYNALKKLYKMNQQEMQSLKQQLNEKRKNHLSNNLVNNELSNNSIMQRQFIQALQNEQSKLKNKINHNKYDEVNNFLQNLTVDIDEYDNKKEFYTNVGTINNFEPLTNRKSLNSEFEQRHKSQELQKHRTAGNFMSKMDFEEQELNYEREFQTQEKIRKQKFREEQQKRREEYMKQIHSFKSSVDPYKLLKLPKNFTEDQLKNAYRKLVLITHPDRPNGSNEKFQIVTKAYMTLLEEYKTRQSDKQFIQLRDEAQQYMENQNRYQSKNIKMSDKFDVNMFNKIYDENRLHEATDDGYEQWMKSSQYNSDDIKKNEVFSEKFNLNVFNSVFENETMNDAKDMVVYKEPEAMNSGGNNCVTLGQDRINNFSGTSNNGNMYTDYKEAFTTTRLINPNSVNRANYKNIDDVKMARSKIEKFTEDEIYEQEMKKKLKEKEENDRQYRLKQNDQKHFNNYSKIHNMMLNYRK